MKNKIFTQIVCTAALMLMLITPVKAGWNPCDLPHMPQYSFTDELEAHLTTFSNDLALKTTSPQSVASISSFTVSASPSTYASGQSLTINFTIDYQTSDLEYLDLVSFTFPSGVTVTGVSGRSPWVGCGGYAADSSFTSDTATWTAPNHPTGCGGFPTGIYDGFMVTVDIDSSFSGSLTVQVSAEGDGWSSAPHSASTTTVLTFSDSFSNPFISEWNTENSNSITIPTTGSGYNYNVYWEKMTDTAVNGTLTGQTGDALITGLEANTEYRIKISGDFPRIYFNDSGDKTKIRNISQWGDIAWKSMNSAFNGCSNLNINATDVPDLNEVSNMSLMFYQCMNLNGPSNIGSWDTSNVTYMIQMFHAAISFNQSLNDWDTSNVTNMGWMFNNALLFNQDLNDWDTSNVTNMSHMFFNADSFNQNLSDWDTSNVISMSYMFMWATSFNQSLNSWDTSNVKYMDDMFRGATSFNQSLNSWDTSNVTSMSQMFFGATSFNQNLNDWDTSNVTSMYNMFTSASSFNQSLNNWNTSNVKYMNGMFSNASSFNQSLGNWDVSNVTDMHYMFDDSGMDCDHYSATLVGWQENNPSLTGLTLGADGLQYGTAAVPARNNLINNQGWVIEGDSPSGADCSALLCPDLSIAPDNVTVTESECQIGGTIGGGMIYAPENTCPEGSTLQYSTDDGLSWSTTLPIYEQTGPAQTIFTRCNCDANNLVSSPISSGAITEPGICMPCDAVTGLQSEELDWNQYKITWNADGATLWTVSVNGGVGVQVTQPEYMMTDLQPLETYTVSVVTNCEFIDSVSETTSFTTAGEPINCDPGIHYISHVSAYNPDDANYMMNNTGYGGPETDYSSESSLHLVIDRTDSDSYAFTFRVEADGGMGSANPDLDYQYEIWIDRNQDGLFENSEYTELFYDGGSNNGYLEGTFDLEDFGGCNHPQGTFQIMIKMSVYDINCDETYSESEIYLTQIIGECTPDPCSVDNYYISYVHAAGPGSVTDYNETEFDTHTPGSNSAITTPVTTPGYGDYSGIVYTLDKSAGDTFSFQIKSEPADTSLNFHYDIWVDRNDDGVLSNNGWGNYLEHLIDIDIPGGDMAYTFDLDDPILNNIVNFCEIPNRDYPLRIIMTVYDEDCQLLYGETEDYTLRIEGDCNDRLNVGTAEFNGFNFYPNPVTATLNLEARQPIQKIEVFNLLGQRVLEVNPDTDQVQLDTQSLSSGVYMMKVTIEGIDKTFKMVRK